MERNIKQTKTEKPSIGDGIVGFIKVFKSELKSQFGVTNLIALFVVIIIPLIGPLVQSKFTTTGAALIRDTNGSLQAIFGQSISFTLVIRLIIIFRERSMLDRNRTLYLKYDKNLVLFNKSFVDLLLFLSSVVSSVVLGPLILFYKREGSLDNYFATNMLVLVIAVSFVYLLMTFGIRWAASTFDDKKVRGAITTAVILLTIGLYVVFATAGVIISDWRLNMISNKYVVAFVPIYNIASIPMAAFYTKDFPLYLVVPFIVYSLAAIALIWKTLARNFKTFLTS